MSKKRKHTHTERNSVNEENTLASNPKWKLRPTKSIAKLSERLLLFFYQVFHLVLIFFAFGCVRACERAHELVLYNNYRERPYHLNSAQRRAHSKGIRNSSNNNNSNNNTTNCKEKYDERKKKTSKRRRRVKPIHNFVCSLVYGDFYSVERTKESIHVWERARLCQPFWDI